MKILVAVKAVHDPALPVYWRQSGPDTLDAPLILNPFDAIALEAAVAWREEGRASWVGSVAVGPATCDEVLRTTLALGAEVAIRLATEAPVTPLMCAKGLATLARQQQVAVVLMGKQGVDEDLGQTGPMLAGLLGWSQATFVSRLTWRDATTLLAQREVDGGVEEVVVPLPAVITVDLRLNTPRYASLPNILKARHKPLACLELPVEPSPVTTTIALQPTPTRPAKGIRLASVAELAQVLADCQEMEKIVYS